MSCFGPDRLYVVAAYSNPQRWQSRQALARKFIQHMLDSGVDVTIVDCAIGERDHELADVPHIRHVAVRARGDALVWNKECLLNIGFSRLPERARYIATLDADIYFRTPTWATDTIEALQHHSVVQPWKHAYDLGPKGEHLETHQSFGSLWSLGEPIVQGPKNPKAAYKFGHPGYAWAWRRELLEATGGVIETAGLGAGDHHMALALIGRVHDSIPHRMTHGYIRPLTRWQERATAAAHHNLGYVPGTIEHGWHGRKAGRQYIPRWKILQDFAFDPAEDTVRNLQGVVELAPRKPQLRDAIRRYFWARDEDTNSIE